MCSQEYKYGSQIFFVISIRLGKKPVAVAQLNLAVVPTETDLIRLEKFKST